MSNSKTVLRFAKRWRRKAKKAAQLLDKGMGAPDPEGGDLMDDALIVLRDLIDDINDFIKREEKTP